MFTEYDAESHMKVVREDGYNEGFNEGHDEGFNECRDELLSQITKTMSKQGKTPEEISALTGIDIDTVNKIYETLQ